MSKKALKEKRSKREIILYIYLFIIIGGRKMYKSKSKPWTKKQKATTYMHKELITIRQQGRRVNLYDLIQSRNIDTEIYPTLYKYGSLKPMEISQEWLSTGLETLESIKDLDRLQREAENLFLELPDEIQNAYKRSYAEFVKDKGQKAFEMIGGTKNETGHTDIDTTNNNQGSDADTKR